MNLPEPIDPKSLAAGMNALRKRLAESVLPRVADAAQQTKIAALIARLEEAEADFPALYERETARLRQQTNEALSKARAIMDQAKQRRAQLERARVEAVASPHVRELAKPAPPEVPAPPPRLWEPGAWPLSDADIAAAGERLVRRVRAAPAPRQPSPLPAGDVAGMESDDWKRSEMPSGGRAGSSSGTHEAAAPPPPPAQPRPRDPDDVADMESNDWKR